MNSEIEWIKIEVISLERYKEDLLPSELLLHKWMRGKIDQATWGSQKLSEMLLKQWNLLCKLWLRGEKCGRNFNQYNVFVKAYSSSICAEVPDRLKVAKKDQSNAFSKRVKNRQIRPKPQNPNPKGITWLWKSWTCYSQMQRKIHGPIWFDAMGSKMFMFF